MNDYQKVVKTSLDEVYRDVEEALSQVENHGDLMGFMGAGSEMISETVDRVAKARTATKLLGIMQRAGIEDDEKESEIIRFIVRTVVNVDIARYLVHRYFEIALTFDSRSEIQEVVEALHAAIDVQRGKAMPVYSTDFVKMLQGEDD